MADPPVQWFAQIGAKYLDLVGDYAGKERFFIEGDSLLLECFGDPQLDFDPGFQLLHAAYLVEKYLHNLQRRGCSFDVVFFQDNAHLCVPPNSNHQPKYLLARTAMIKHLQKHAVNTSLLCFKNPDDEAFSQYLQDSACYFALCSDGASYKYSKQKSLHLQGHAVNFSDRDSPKDNKFELRTTIWKLMDKKGLDVALLNGLAWQDSKVFAFVLERNAKFKGISTPSNISLDGILANEHSQGNSNTEALSANGAAYALRKGSSEDLASAAVPILQQAGLPASSRVMITLAVLCHTSLHFKIYLLPHLVHTIYLEALPLAARKVSTVEFPREFEQTFSAYQNEFFGLCNDHMNSGTDIDSTVMDLVDGRLLRHVLHDPETALSQLPEEHAEAARLLAKSIVDTKEVSGPIGQIQIPPPSSGVLSANTSVLPFSHPAFDKHLDMIHVQVDASKQPVAGKLALELTHWHNSKMLLLPRGQKPRRDPVEEKRSQRAHQRFIAQLTGYAISLTDTKDNSLHQKTVRVDQPSNSRSMNPTPTNNGTIRTLVQQNKLKKAKPGKQTAKSLLDQSTARDITEPLTPDSLLDCLANDSPRLDRSMDAKDDARVPFKPDGWQVKVLDEMDAGNSLLVVAPTSAGKTFISFYAMEKVLRASDDAVLVYVAPTKALVNQIAAEVLGKFNKNYRYPGTTVYSIFTRDYRVHNPTKAQILVTVPHLLQIMLMAPTNKDWVPRIKTIIFDEVHSISQADDGLIWEQLLMAAPCQIIALSATIGNASEFANWLSSAQSSTGRAFTLVQHDQRYSDLRKYIYTTSTNKPDLGTGLPAPASSASETLGLEKIKSMEHIHPVACLLHPQRGMPSDLTLESGDCLRLWKTMKKYQTPEYDVPEELAPTRYFGSKRPIKADIIRWGTSLKELLACWMKERESSPFGKVVDYLRHNIQAPAISPEELPSQKGAEKGENLSVELLNSTLPMLCDLRVNDALPAILFNYNRSVCEDIAQHLLDQLVEAETKFKEKDAAWQAKIDKYTVWQKNAPARERAQKRADEKTKKKPKGKEAKEAKDSEKDGIGSKADRSQAEYEAKDLFFETFDPDAPLDQFSFANIKKRDNQLMEDSIGHFVRVGIPEKLIEAFRRGIGVHHAGMNRWYRQATEMFFRRGFLTVVVATGTLSLGINMPCKSVVFSGDSAYLTALNYRQASGRAGRRGFDLLGNVVFQSLPTEKALRLMSSKLPDINGHFPLTTVFVLRLLSLLHGTNNADYAMQMVNALLSKPRLFSGGADFKHQVLHHVRFSIEYLRAQGLLNAQGHPIGFASCVSHLYFVENSALAFHALLKEGYFHDLAGEVRADEERILKKLMLVMSNLFGRRPMRSINSDEEKEFIRKSVSLVVLPEMPREATIILREHNKQTLHTYRTYVSTFVEQHCQEPDVTLPFTKTCVSSPPGAQPSPQLPGARSAPKMRSPFAALSGLDDDFSSITELCDTVRGGIFLEKAVIPYLDMGDELTTPLNAYLYDFYNNGSPKALIEANRIPRGDLWFLLKDFSLVLATVVTSIENFLNPKQGSDLDLANDGESDHEDDATLTEGGESTVTTESNIAPMKLNNGVSSDTTRSNTPEPNAVPKPTVKLKKQKVLDSWDDEESSESEREEQREDLDEAVRKAAAEKTERELKKVYQMFKKLQEEFEAKFKKMWA